LGTTKKAVLEDAVRCYAEKIATEEGFDVLTHTFGCWQRNQSAAEIVRVVKETIRNAQERHRQ
jgi:hypothetical protein